jgi:hypothetical protein
VSVLGAVAVPPAAGAGALAVASLGALIAFIVAWGLAHGWAATFGYLFSRIANWTIHVAHFTVTPFHALAGVDTYVRRQLDQFQAMSEHAMVYTFGKAIELTSWTAYTIEKLAADTWHGIQHRTATITHTVTTRVTHTVIKPITKTIHATSGITAAMYHALTQRVTALAAHVAHIAKSIPHAIPHVIPRLGRLERTAVDYVKLHKWLKRALAGALGLTVVLAALKRAGLSFIRCTNVKKTGKRLCGLDPGLLDALLLGTTLIVGTISLREFAQEVESVTDEVSGLIHGFIRDA